MTIESIAPTAASPRRLHEVDALRGLAALSVVFFHYLDRHEQTIGHVDEPLFWFPWGGSGVQLFFVISGFVIFMTLDRTQRPMDFVVSRFARLYPVYWAAMAVTIVVLLATDLPNYRIESVTQVLVNLTMWQQLFNVREIDGAYWTLYVELWFYVVMLALFARGELRRIEAWLAAGLAVNWAWWFGLALYGEFGWSFRLWVVIGKVLPEIPFFVIGVAIFRLWRGEQASRALTIMLAALVTVAAQRNRVDAGVAIAAIGLFSLILSGRAAFLRNGLMLWLGAISYSLYLIHNFAGRSLIAQLQGADWSANESVVFVTLLALACATILTFWIERPAQRAIRNWWQRRRGAMSAAAI